MDLSLWRIIAQLDYMFHNFFELYKYLKTDNEQCELYSNYNTEIFYQLKNKCYTRKNDENGLGDRKSMINAAAILDAALHPAFLYNGAYTEEW